MNRESDVWIYAVQANSSDKTIYFRWLNESTKIPGIHYECFFCAKPAQLESVKSTLSPEQDIPATFDPDFFESVELENRIHWCEDCAKGWRDSNIIDKWHFARGYKNFLENQKGGSDAS